MTMMTPDVLNEGSGLSAEVGTAGPVDKSARLDRIGVVASAACAVHCLVAPLLMLALPGFLNPRSTPQFNSWQHYPSSTQVSQISRAGCKDGNWLPKGIELN